MQRAICPWFEQRWSPAAQSWSCRKSSSRLFSVLGRWRICACSAAISCGSAFLRGLLFGRSLTRASIFIVFGSGNQTSSLGCSFSSQSLLPILLWVFPSFVTVDIGLLYGSAVVYALDNAKAPHAVQGSYTGRLLYCRFYGLFSNERTANSCHGARGRAQVTCCRSASPNVQCLEK